MAMALKKKTISMIGSSRAGPPMPARTGDGVDTDGSGGQCRIMDPQTLERFELWGACGDLNLPNLPTRDPPKPSVSSSRGQRDIAVYPGSGHPCGVIP